MMTGGRLGHAAELAVELRAVVVTASARNLLDEGRATLARRRRLCRELPTESPMAPSSGHRPNIDDPDPYIAS